MEKKRSPYDELTSQIKVLKDRIRGVVHKKATGVYIYGRPGTSKTYTVRTTLETLGVNYVYKIGHLAPIGLFDLIAENHDRVIVLDDVSAIFKQPIALQILLAALGNTHKDTGERIITHKTNHGERTVKFTGGIIAISNLALNGHDNQILRALHDRVFAINYNPTDEQIVALMEAIAKQGVNGVSPKECLMVLNFLKNELSSREIRPTIRLFLDKALKDYELWKLNATESHWKDLVVSNLEQQLVNLQHPTNDISRAEQKESEIRIAVDVKLRFDDRTKQLHAWKERTGKSQAAYYRRLKEAKAMGLLPE